MLWNDHRMGLIEWNGMEWNGMDWYGIGMEWNGMEWIGIEWNGMGWNGIDSINNDQWGIGVNQMEWIYDQ